MASSAMRPPPTSPALSASQLRPAPPPPPCPPAAYSIDENIVISGFTAASVFSERRYEATQTVIDRKAMIAIPS